MALDLRIARGLGGLTMAVTDDQLQELHRHAEAAGRDSKGGPPHPKRTAIAEAFARAADAGMRTQDAHSAPVAPMDLPDPADQRELYESYQRGRTALATPADTTQRQEQG